MSRNRVVIKSTLSSVFVPKAIQEMDLVALEMATDVHRVATILAPKDSRALVNSGRVIRQKLAEYVIRFGGSGNGFSVPYALRRHFENMKNPQTLLYLERGGDSVKRSSISKYLRRLK